MSSNGKKSTIDAAKTILIAGYAVSLFVPYRVEKHNGETTYHAPLYKLSYKSAEIPQEPYCNADESPKDKKSQTVHTYTITSFGLLNDQIDTAKRLYKAVMLKKPYIESKAKSAVRCVSEKTRSTVSYAKKQAKSTARSVGEKAKCTAKNASMTARVKINLAKSYATDAFADLSVKTQTVYETAKATAKKTAVDLKTKLKSKSADVCITEESSEE